MFKKKTLFKSIQDDDDYYHDADSNYSGGEDDGGGKQNSKQRNDEFKKNAEDFNACPGFARERSCTDLCFLLVFIAFLGSMLYLTFLGYKAGEINKLLAPVDGDFNLCGWYNETAGHVYNNTEYQKLLITDWSNPTPAVLFESSVCVKECPKTDALVVDFQPTENVPAGSLDQTEFTEDWQVNSYSVMKICIPLDPPATVQAAVDQLKAMLLSGNTGVWLNDLYRASRAIYLSIAMSIVYSILFVYFLSAFGETIAWICVVLIQLAFIGGAAAGFFAWTAQKEKVAGLDQTNIASNYQQEKKTENLMMAGMGVFGLLALLFACAIYCKFKELKTAIDVVDASADFLAKTKRVIGVPFVFFFLSIISVLVWSGSFAAVISMNHIQVNEDIPQGKNLVWEPKIKYMALYMFFGILWVTAFFEYCSTFTIMVSACTYYWNSSAHEEGHAEVSVGFSACFSHAGSLAIGSFIIAVIRFIRIVFMFLAKQIEKQSGDNPVVKGIVKCAECVLACIEKICNYINESAFAYQACSGENFCSSAWNAFMLQLKHMAKFTFAQLIAKMFILLGKVGIVAGNVVSCFYIMKLVFKDFEDDPANDDQAVTSAVAPLVVVGVFTFLVASLFVGILDTVVLALLTCVAIDQDNNNGTPAFGPPTFHEATQKMHGDFKTAEEHAEEEGGIKEVPAINYEIKETFLYHVFR